MKLTVVFEEKKTNFQLSFGEIQKVGGATEDVPIYNGTYNIIPAVDDQTLPTAQKFLTSNIKVDAIPYAEVSNIAGGKTVTIG